MLWLITAYSSSQLEGQRQKGGGEGRGHYTSHANTEIQVYHICLGSHHCMRDRRKAPEMGILGNLSRGTMHLRTTPFFIRAKRKKNQGYSNGYQYNCKVNAVSLRKLNLWILLRRNPWNSFILCKTKRLSLKCVVYTEVCSVNNFFLHNPRLNWKREKRRETQVTTADCHLCGAGTVSQSQHTGFGYFSKQNT